jgi:multidrug efflux pump subunit AcrA (membrane-fusion protein)
VLFAGGFVAAVAIHVPETVSSTFVLVPVRGTDPIRAPRSGIVADVRVAQGRSVQQGDPLFVVRSPVAGDRSAELKSLEAQLAGAEEAHVNARRKYESQRQSDEEEARRLTRRAGYLTQKLDEQRALRATRQAKYRADLEIQQNEIDIAEKEIGFKKTQHALAAELAERLEREHNAGGISWLEYNTHRLDATRLAVEQQQLERNLETLHLKLNQLRTEQETREIDWRMTVAELEAERHDVDGASEKLRYADAARDAEYRELDRRLSEDSAKARIRAATLQEELGRNSSGELAVVAPCAGTVVRLPVKGPGAVVQDGDVLCEVACAEGALQAELTVPPRGVSRLKPGQGAKLLYDAFPYQRYGVRSGTVRWTSPAGVSVDGTSAFRALVDLTDKTILVDGQSRPLLAGMGGRAEVVVGRRTLIGYALEPLRQLKESLAAPAVNK